MKREFGSCSRRDSLKKQLSILIQLAKVDGNYDQEEKSLIREFSRKFNIAPNEIKEIERHPDNCESISAFTMDEKVELLYNAVWLAKVDKRIMPTEVVYCQEIASKLGFRKSAFQAMLPLVNNQPVELVNYTAVRRKIAPYL